MTWEGRSPPCYEFRADLGSYVFHVSEKESVEIGPGNTYPPFNVETSPRAPLVRLLTGVSPVEMLSNPGRWARFYGTKSEDRRS